MGGCFSDRRLTDAGTGSETTNHITGAILDGGVASSARTQVLLVRSDFNPVTDSLPASRMDTTDAKGRFEFSNPGSGNYQLEAVGLVNGLRGLKEDFHYSSGEQTVPDMMLGRPAFIRVSLPESLRLVGSYIFIPGTTFSVRVGELRISTLGPLPAMRIPELAYVKSPGSAHVTLARDLAVRADDTLRIKLDTADTTIIPGDTTGIPPKDSSRAWQLRLNTTPSGASVGIDVFSFPMLVRLDSDNFDFTQVRDGGTGIGFFKPDSTRLPFEIERWDSTARKAEIWVSMDTVQGATDTQTVWMRRAAYGSLATGTEPSSSGADVFPYKKGYVGVWHLGTASGDRPDATGNGHWGRPIGYEGDEKVEGVVGPADSLGTGDDLLDVGLVNVERSITMSAWVRARRAGGWTPIIQKPALIHPDVPIYSYGLWEYNGSPYNLSMEVSDGGHAPSLDATGNLSGWALIHATFDGTTSSLYCNGALVRTTTGQYSMGLEGNNLSTLIGASPHNSGNKFVGVVDEVRIEWAVRGPFWIRLSHENQKPGQTLVNLVR